MPGVIIGQILEPYHFLIYPGERDNPQSLVMIVCGFVIHLVINAVYCLYHLMPSMHNSGLVQSNNGVKGTPTSFNIQRRSEREEVLYAGNGWYQLPHTSTQVPKV